MEKRIYNDLARYYPSFQKALLRGSQTVENEIHFLKTYFAGARVHTVLDLGGGVGSVAVPLQHAGMTVSVFDQSASALRILRERAPEIKGIEGSFESITDQEVYDGVYCMWSTINYVLQEEGKKHIFSWLAEHAKKSIVLDQANPQNMPTYFEKTYTYDGEDHIFEVDRKWHFQDQVRTTAYMYKVTDKATGVVESYEDSERQYFYTLEELTAYLGEEWKVERVYGEYSMDAPYDPATSSRMIVALTRL